MRGGVVAHSHHLDHATSHRRRHEQSWGTCERPPGTGHPGHLSGWEPIMSPAFVGGPLCAGSRTWLMDPRPAGLMLHIPHTHVSATCRWRPQRVAWQEPPHAPIDPERSHRLHRTFSLQFSGVSTINRFPKVGLLRLLKRCAQISAGKCSNPVGDGVSCRSKQQQSDLVFVTLI